MFGAFACFWWIRRFIVMTSSQVGNKEENPPAKKTLNFSIEHILNKAGNSGQVNDESAGANLINSSYSYVTYPWLHCTRYCPPKLTRTQKRETPQKRQLGRHPRIPFTSHQLAVLEEKFKQSPYLSSQEVTQVSGSLELADIRVKIWFQNRRARERRERSSGNLGQEPNSRLVAESNMTQPIICSTALLNNALHTETQILHVPIDRLQNNECCNKFNFVPSDLLNSPTNSSYSE